MPPAPRDRGAAASARTRGDLDATGSATSTAFDSDEDCDRFLDRKTPEELVAIFADSDPLRITERCSRFLWGEGLFLDADRLVEHAIYHTAFRIPQRPRQSPLDAWLLECISESALRLLRQDVEMVAQVRGQKVEAWAPAHEFVCGAFGIRDVEALEVCSAFNSMARRERQAFFALIMDKRSVEDCVDAGFGPREWLRETCIRGLDRLLGVAAHPGLEPCDDNEEGESDER